MLHIKPQAVEKELSGGRPRHPICSSMLRCRSVDTTLQSSVKSAQAHAHLMVEHALGQIFEEEASLILVNNRIYTIK